MKRASLALICLGLLTAPGVARSLDPKPQTPKRTVTKNLIERKVLDVDDVLAWKTPFADLLGKPKDVAVERYGAPDRQTETTLRYQGNAKTLFRSLIIFVANNTITSIKVFSHPWEALPIDRVIKRAKMFCFTSGTFEDSTDDYFSADTVDGRNSIQFTISQSNIDLTDISFDNIPLECDPSRVVYK
jgi:hypothetical protein